MYSLDDYLSSEIFRGKKFSRLELIKARFFNASVDALYLLRCYLVWSEEKTHKLRRNMHKRALINKYGIFISPNTSIDIGLKLPHPQGIIFGEYVKIGSRATIYQQVTFGGRNMGDAQLRKYPNVGDNCTFFAGSKVLGDIKVADNTTLGANAVLLNDTVKGEVYVGMPAKSTKGSI